MAPLTLKKELDQIFQDDDSLAQFMENHNIELIDGYSNLNVSYNVKSRQFVVALTPTLNQGEDELGIGLYSSNDTALITEEYVYKQTKFQIPIKVVDGTPTLFTKDDYNNLKKDFVLLISEYDFSNEEDGQWYAIYDPELQPKEIGGMSFSFEKAEDFGKEDLEGIRFIELNQVAGYKPEDDGEYDSGFHCQKLIGLKIKIQDGKVIYPTNKTR